MSFTDSRKVTASGKPPAEGYEDASAPQPIGPSGQHGDYWVLSEEERKKGFVRPVRNSYKHVGIRPNFPLRDLTEEEKTRFGKDLYVAFEKYPEGKDSHSGRYWTKAQLEKRSGCQTVTKMGHALSETWARDPLFYGKTFCCHCADHFRVEEFVWEGTDERLGS